MSRLAVFLILALEWTGICAQEKMWVFKATGGIDLGLTLPVPLSAAPDDVQFKPRLMPTAGLGAELYISEKWSFGPEFNFHILSHKATMSVISQPLWSDDKSYTTYFSGVLVTNTELRFIEFPLLAHYHINGRWAIDAGTYFSVILYAKIETQGMNGWASTNMDDTDNAPLPGNQDIHYSYDDELDNYDIGGLLGVTFNISQRFIIWGRLNVGFKSIFEPDFDHLDYDMYQMRFSLGISFAFLNR